jgi:hypothetical protein
MAVTIVGAPRRRPAGDDRHQHGHAARGAGVAASWAQQLGQFGQLSVRTLTAKLVGSGTLQGLVSGIDMADIGAGLVLAPQN